MIVIVGVGVGGGGFCGDESGFQAGWGGFCGGESVFQAVVVGPTHKVDFSCAKMKVRSARKGVEW